MLEAISNCESLDAIGGRFGTDKCSRAHDYLCKYEHFLAKFKSRSFDLVEIGVFNGDSAKTWLEYFPQATIHCIDIDPDRANIVKHPRYKGYCLDQGDIGAMTRLISDIRPLVLIDDGSHFWDHQITTLLHFAPLVRRRGLVIIEDLEVNYPPLDSTYSRGYSQRPVDLMLSMGAVVASGGLDLQHRRLPVIAQSHDLFSSISFVKHSLIACRVNYYNHVAS